ncbi:hypothetical protein ACFL3C_04760 [Patescibacteria group bacterium]
MLEERYIEEYKAILAKLGERCHKTYEKLSFLPCKESCSECCEQFFPVSFIEAHYLSMGLKELSRQQRRLMQKAANKIKDKLDKNPFSEGKRFFVGTKEEIYKKQHEFGSHLRGMEYDCPYLNDEKLCEVYESRPHDCRVHGCSIDKSTKEVLGCFRFNVIPQLQNPEVREDLVDFDYLYPEIRSLDAASIRSITGHPVGVHVWYFASPIDPILNNYEEKDWSQVFDMDWDSVKEGDYVLVLDY